MSHNISLITNHNVYDRFTKVKRNDVARGERTLVSRNYVSRLERDRKKTKGEREQQRPSEQRPQPSIYLCYGRRSKGVAAARVVGVRGRSLGLCLFSLDHIA